MYGGKARCFKGLGGNHDRSMKYREEDVEGGNVFHSNLGLKSLKLSTFKTADNLFQLSFGLA